MAAIGLPAIAGNHWLSRAHLYDLNGKAVTVSHLKAASLDGTNLSTTSANAVFDIVISLEDNPLGDDDASVDAGTSDDAQNAYENRIKEFANAVFEATNGAHKIGRVTVYREYKQRNLADVQWETDCASDNGPWAHPGGFQKAGKYIHFCTNWPGAPSSMPTPKGSGYTLAHEWGHYAYNIFDEYAANQCVINVSTMFGALCPAWQPRATDTVSDTIMHNQWYAANGGVRSGYTGNSADYLEFSTQNHEPFVTPLGAGATGRNGQERYFGESGWETLTRDPSTDPSWPGLDRTQYTNLTAPTAPDWIVSGGTTGAQSELDIRWVGDQVVELLIDRSGSMSGSPLTNAKTGGSLLIASLPEGESAIGVASFETNQTQDYPITDIPDPDTTIKADATAVVNGLPLGGSTSLYDGLILALNELVTFQTVNATSREGVVYVLSDGGDNDSETYNEADVIAAYQAEGVPIVAFGYGSSAPTGTLSAMAAATGGLYLQSPTTAGEITAALLSANASFSNSAIVGTGSDIAPANSTDTVGIPVDSTINVLNLNVTYSGIVSDLSLRLLDPSGSDTGVTPDCSSDSVGSSCTIEVDNATLTAGGTGEYDLELTNTTGTDIDYSIAVSAQPKAGTGYNVAVSISSGLDTVYPAPMLIEATVRSDTPITGLDVVATVTPPFSSDVDVTLVDDGTNGDAIPDDGTYTGSYHYTNSGVHTVKVSADNSAGNAQTTAEGVAVAVGVNGTVETPTPTPITENFLRQSTNTTVVASFFGEDHSNDPTVPAACTAVQDNNAKTEGRIDYAGDVDCFFFTPSSTSDPLVARITNLSGGMAPVIKVYNEDGSTELLEVTLATSENDTVGTVGTIPASALLAAGHVVTVEHADSAASEGNYRVSVGPSQISDVAQLGEEEENDDDSSSSGGAIGPWSALVLALLAIVGLRQRRRMV